MQSLVISLSFAELDPSNKVTQADEAQAEFKVKVAQLKARGIARVEEGAFEDAVQVSTRILGRRTAPFPPFLIPHRVPRGCTPIS